MKKYFLIPFLIVSFFANGQKFKDIFPTLVSASDEEALSILKSYMINDLDHPNANLRLALIYEKRYRSSDPITEYEKVMANAAESQLRFTKSAALVNAKEVSKNKGYYNQFASGFDGKGRPIIEFETVNGKIRRGFDSAKFVTDNLPTVYDYFTQSVNYHDKAIKAFNAINGQFNSRDKLLLMHDNQLRAKLETLISDYDSSIYYLDKYLESGKSFDGNHFNQSYTVKDIDTYRLQGLLTSPSFLVDQIEIWNYKKWAQEAIKEVETEISQLRSDLNRVELELNSSLKKISPYVASPNFDPYKIDGKLLFNLVKYDNQSLPVSLLKYKQFKQNLLYQLGVVNDRDTTGADIVYLVQLGELIYRSKDADSLLQIVEGRVNEENINKYQSYFRTHYQELKGTKNFISEEKKLVKESSDKGVSLMLETIISNEKQANDNEFVTYRRLKIPSSPVNLSIDSLDTSPITTHKTISGDGSQYLAGLKKQNKAPGHVLVYLAKVAENGRVLWYKEYSFTEDNSAAIINEIGSITATPEGCALMIRSKTSSGLLNRLFYVSETGEDIFNKELDLPLYPRAIKYVEQTNAFLMTYKGVQQEMAINAKETTQLMSINILSDVLWSQDFDYAGDIVEVVTLEDGFMILGNYSEIKDTEGKTFKTRINNNQTNAFAARFSRNGKLMKVAAIETPKNYTIERIIKVNDRIINLLGHDGTKIEKGNNDVHIIVNQATDIIHSNL